MKWLPFLKSWKKTYPELPYESPIWLGNRSNGEFFHEQTPRERKVRKEILRVCAAKANRLGMDRREFMASTMGMATTLAVIQACGGGGNGNAGSGGAGGAGVGGAGGTAGAGYCIPEAATCDEEAARELIGLGTCATDPNNPYFIIDMQSHCIEDEETWRDLHPGQSYDAGNFLAGLLSFDPVCGRAPECIGDDRYVQEILMNSDTSIAVLSGFPGGICNELGAGGPSECPGYPRPELHGHVLSNNFMAILRDAVNSEAASQRMVQHCQVAPNDDWPLQAQMMDRIKDTYGNHGWKCYPPWSRAFDGVSGWWLDDDMNRMDPNAPGPVADALFQKITDLTPSHPVMGCAADFPQKPVLCVHKGPSFGGLIFTVAHNDTRDVPLAAKKWPDIQFVIYHSGGGGTRGVDGFVEDIESAGLTGKNVYAEIGSTWGAAATNPDNAVHLIGKLLRAFGDDNVLYGSESMWAGNPQWQIEALKCLQIPANNPWGYPELTPERKAKILGLNAAKLYNLDVDAARCRVRSDSVVRVKERLDAELGPRRWAVYNAPGGPRTRGEFLRLAKLRKALGVPG